MVISSLVLYGSFLALIWLFIFLVFRCELEFRQICYFDYGYLFSIKAVLVIALIRAEMNSMVTQTDSGANRVSNVLADMLDEFCCPECTTIS